MTIVTGTMDFGMGHATTYAQILSDQLGIPFDRIRTVEGDSDRMAFGGGSGGSRSVMFVGAALAESSALVIEHGKQIASHVLEASTQRYRIQDRTLRHRRHRPLDRRCSNWPNVCAAVSSCRTACRPRSTSIT